MRYISTAGWCYRRDIDSARILRALNSEYQSAIIALNKYIAILLG